MPRKKKEEKLNFEQFVSEQETPQSFEIECAVLGTILIERGALEKFFRFVKNDEVFYNLANQTIYKTIKKLYQDKKAVDILTVTDEMRRSDELESVGGAFYITNLTSNIVSGDNIETHCGILFQYYLRRNLTDYAMAVYGEAMNYKADEFETFDKAILNLDSIKAQIISMKEIGFPQQVDEAVQDVVDAMNGKVKIIKTGLTNLDEVIGGRMAGESHIIAARTSMGKTTRMIREILHVTIGNHYKVGVISLETKSATLIKKMLSNISKIDSTLLRDGKITIGQLESIYNARDLLKQYNILIHDMGNINVTDLRAIGNRWKAQNDIDILYIDYLTLIKHQNPFTKNTNDEIEKISGGIKQLAMDLNIPIVTLAQINRSPEARSDKRPTLSDLRSSGAIEMDADAISILYRPEYYGITEDATGQSLIGVMEESIQKDRNGKLGYVYYKFTPEIGEFEPLSYMPEFNTKRQSTSHQNGVDVNQKQAVEPLPW